MSKGGDAVTTVFGALAGVVGGLFGFLTILILTFYLLVEAATLRASLLRLFAAGAARARGRHESRHHAEGQRLARRSAVSRRHYRIDLRSRPVADRSAFLLRAGAHLRSRRAHSCRRARSFRRFRRSLVASTVSLKAALFVIIFFIVQQQFENHLLVPKIMARQVGVSAVTVIVSLLIGGKLLGILGAILAVPTAAILQVLFSELTNTEE